MITARSLEDLEAQFSKETIRKYERVRPAVTIFELGKYGVVNSKGETYEVLAGRRPDGQLFIACPCRGALEGHGCYHAFIVLRVHTAMVKSEREKQMEAK
jgi:hypothetical protein